MMITSDVATARRKLNANHSVSTGTMRKPPPTPKKPVRPPTPRPARTTGRAATGGQGPVRSPLTCAARCHVAPEATSMTGTKVRISTSPLTAVFASVPSSAPAAAGAVNVSAIRQQTCPRSASAPAPTAAAIATTMSDAVEAGPTPMPRT